MKWMTWDTDPVTQFWAARCLIKMGRNARSQYPGDNTSLLLSTANRMLVKKAMPAHCIESTGTHIRCAPENIVQCCQRGDVLEALVMVVAWGGLWRTKSQVYTAALPSMAKSLRAAVRSLAKEGTCREAWKILTADLGWTSVPASKFLHFAARSSGFTANPPVPLDNAVFMEGVWPSWKDDLQWSRRRDPTLARMQLPGTWRGRSWGAYCRYMTAISVWAAQRGWTTTEVENTLYKDYEVAD